MVDCPSEGVKGIYDCPILTVRNLIGDIYLMRMHCPAISRLVLPGQFINIKVNQELIPLLRKPFSICRCSKAEGWIEVLWKIVGQGTATMARYSAGEQTNVMGPLGRGFCVPPGISAAYLVGGGLGVAPLPFLCQNLLARGISVEVFLGAKSEAELSFLNEFEEMGVDVWVSTEDGSSGYRGLVTDMVIRRIKETESLPEKHLYSCGPTEFLKSMINITLTFEIDGQVSLETMMGCGFGICVGCPVRMKGHEATDNMYSLTCIDGPAFDAREVFLD